MQIKTNRKSGFTLVEIMIVVAIIGLLAAIAIPNFIRARTQSQKTACINNLRQIDGAVQQYALENKLDAAATVTQGNITPFLGRGAGEFPTCPSAGTYGAAAGVGDFAVAGKPTCSKEASDGHVLPAP